MTAEQDLVLSLERQVGPIGEVSLNGIRSSDLGLTFRDIEGHLSINVTRELVRLLARHGGRAVGHGLIEPRTLKLKPESYAATDRAQIHAVRARINSLVARPAILDEIPIYFHETRRTVYGHLQENLFTDGLTQDAAWKKFFDVGFTFFCPDPLVYGQEQAEEFVSSPGERIELEVGDLDNWIEVRFRNDSPTVAVALGLIDLHDEISRDHFTYNPTITPIPGNADLVFNSREYDVYLEDRTSLVRTRTGVLKAVTSPWPLPLLTRDNLTNDAALVVDAGPGFSGQVLSTPIYLAI